MNSDENIKKIMTVKNYIQKYSDLAEQGSRDWLNSRKLIIGGSELSALDNSNNYFNSVEKLISTKVGLFPFDGNIYTEWGNIFEDVTSRLFTMMFLNDKEYKHIYKDKIYSLGSVPHETIKEHAFSCDGLCIMNINNVKTIVLLEFKSPYISNVNKTIPKYYMSQVKGGMCTINICEKAVFVSNSFRRCSFKDLGYNMNYVENNKNKPIYKKLNDKQPLAYGIILFYINDKKKFKSLVDSDTICTNINKKIENDNIIDLGLENEDILYYIMKNSKLNYSDSLFHYKKIVPTINSEYIMNDPINIFISEELKSTLYYKNLNNTKKYNYNESLTSLKENIKNKHNKEVFAVLPWKLIKSSFILEHKDNDYLENLRDKMEFVINTVKYINSICKTDEEKKQIINKLFPENKLFFNEEKIISKFQDMVIM